MRNSRAIALGGFCLAALLLAGCEGSNFAEVKGTVTVDGKLVEKGAINFFPVDRDSAGTAGGPITDGKYVVKVPLGSMKVTISAPKVVGTRRPYPDSPEVPTYGESLPEKFADRQETELLYDVKPGQHTKNWDLKTP